MQRIDTIIPEHQQLLWLNQNEQQRVQAVAERGGNGALIYEQYVLPGGFPLIIGTANSGMTRTDFEALQQHNYSTLTPFELELDGNSWNVIWDNRDGPAVTGEDLFPTVGGDSLLSNVVLKFLTAEA